MGLGELYFRLFKEKYYYTVPFGLLIINWLFQRVLRLNKEVPFSIHFTSKLLGFNKMKIDKSVRKSLTISPNLYLVCFDGGRLVIGKDTLIAPNVVINNGNHDLIDRKKHLVKDIIIGNNCWIAANTVILGGTVLGDNVTVAAGSVVNKEFPNNVVIGGSPAKIIKKLDD